MSNVHQLHREPMHLTFGERLRLARERSGIGLGEFARMIGKHRNTPTRWEARDAPPNYEVAAIYAKHCKQTTIEWLLHEMGDWPPTGENDNTPPDGGIHQGGVNDDVGRAGLEPATKRLYLAPLLAA